MKPTLKKKRVAVNVTTTFETERLTVHEKNIGVVRVQHIYRLTFATKDDAAKYYRKAKATQDRITEISVEEQT